MTSKVLDGAQKNNSYTYIVGAGGCTCSRDTGTLFLGSCSLDGLEVLQGIAELFSQSSLLQLQLTLQVEN